MSLIILQQRYGQNLWIPVHFTDSCCSTVCPLSLSLSPARSVAIENPDWHVRSWTWVWRDSKSRIFMPSGVMSLPYLFSIKSRTRLQNSGCGWTWRRGHDYKHGAYCLLFDLVLNTLILISLDLNHFLFVSCVYFPSKSLEFSFIFIIYF